MQPASGLFDVPHIHQRPGATNIEATPAIPVEAVAQNQYHCPGSSCWDVSGGPAGGRSWRRRVAWPAVEERAGGALVRGEIGGVVPRTENDRVSDSFNLFLGRKAALVETTVEHRRGVCVSMCLCACPHVHCLPLCRYQAAGLLRVEIGPKRHLIVSNFTSGRRFQSMHLPSSIDLPDCPYRRRHLHMPDPWQWHARAVRENAGYDFHMQASWAEGITLQSIYGLRRAGRTRNPTFMFPPPPKQGTCRCIQSGHVFLVCCVCVESTQL